MQGYLIQLIVLVVLVLVCALPAILLLTSQLYILKHHKKWGWILVIGSILLWLFVLIYGKKIRYMNPFYVYPSFFLMVAMITSVWFNKKEMSLKKILILCVSIVGILSFLISDQLYRVTTYVDEKEINAQYGLQLDESWRCSIETPYSLTNHHASVTHCMSFEVMNHDQQYSVHIWISRDKKSFDQPLQQLLILRQEDKPLLQEQWMEDRMYEVSQFKVGLDDVYYRIEFVEHDYIYRIHVHCNDGFDSTAMNVKPSSLDRQTILTIMQVLMPSTIEGKS